MTAIPFANAHGDNKQTMLICGKQRSRSRSMLIVGVYLAVSILLSLNYASRVSSAGWNAFSFEMSTTSLKTEEDLLSDLQELVQSHKADLMVCEDPLVLVRDVIQEAKEEPMFGGGDKYKKTWKVPRIVHVLSKSRCNDPIIAKNLDTWWLAGYTFSLYDDEAVDNLLQRD